MVLSRKALNRIVTYSFGIKASEKVLIMGPVKWMRAVAMECKEIGASPLLYKGTFRSARQRAWMSSHTRFRSVTDEQLPSIAEEVDAWVQIRPPLAHRAKKSARKRRKSKSGVPDWLERIRTRGVRQCEFTVPEGSLETRDAVIGALEADVDHMVALGEKLRQFLISARDVHVATELGTDLHLALAGKGVAVDCGRWDPDLQIDNSIYVPGGVVETMPIETSANGSVYVPKAYLSYAHDGWIKGLRLQFDGGKVNLNTVRSGLRTFNRIMGEATGDKDVIAEFSIGVNPNVRALIRCMTVDELMGGSVHVAIGDNYWWMNGKNRSSLHWDFILPEATVEFDGKAILERGKFPFN